MSTETVQEPATSDAQRFAEDFAAGWAMGAGEGFFEHFASRSHPDVRLEQPLFPSGVGARGMRALFGPLFRAIPDLRGDVVRWGATADGVIIELRLHGTFAGLPIAWTTVDVIVLEDGLMRSRKAHFDPLPLVAQMARRPLALARLLPAVARRGDRR